jgi:DNA repair ATPase RecN
MATLFPFNLISGVPIKILNQFLKPVNKQLNKLDELANDLNNSVSSLSKNASCDDIEIVILKNKLQILLESIENMQQLAQFFPQISTGLRTLNTTALFVGAAQLAIPSAPGVPQGPIGQTIASSADTVAAIKACIVVLQNVIESINDSLQDASEAVSNANSAINDICKNTDAAGDDDGALDPINLDDLEDRYFSEFYRNINVSDEDLQQRLDTIQKLIDEQLNIQTNLNEAPSRVLTGIGVPRETLGQPGDYYIDERTQTIYGPKVNIDSWN